MHILWHITASINIYLRTVKHICVNPIHIGLILIYSLCSNMLNYIKCVMTSGLMITAIWHTTWQSTEKKSFISAYKMCIYASFQQASRTIERLCLLIQSTSLFLRHKVTYKIKVMCEINYTRLNKESLLCSCTIATILLLQYHN